MRLFGRGLVAALRLTQPTLPLLQTPLNLLHFLELLLSLGSLPESVLRSIQLALFDFSLSCPLETPTRQKRPGFIQTNEGGVHRQPGFCSDSMGQHVFPGKISPSFPSAGSLEQLDSKASGTQWESHRGKLGRGNQNKSSHMEVGAGCGSW